MSLDEGMYAIMQEDLGQERLSSILRFERLAQYSDTFGTLIVDRIIVSIRNSRRFAAHLKRVETALEEVHLKTETKTGKPRKQRPKTKPEEPRKFLWTCAEHARRRRWYWTVQTWMTASGYTGDLLKVRRWNRKDSEILHSRIELDRYGDCVVIERYPLISVISGERLVGYNTPPAVVSACLRFHGHRVRSGHIIAIQANWKDAWMMRI